MSKRDELFQCKRYAMQLMDAGASWQEANEQSGLNYSKSGIQRLHCEWRERGDEVLVDHRHGHPYKATAEVRDWMGERCTEDSEVRASQLTVEIEARFGVELHHDYVGLLRRQLGLPVPRPGRPSKKQEAEPAPETESGRDFPPREDEAPVQRCEAAGAYLMLGALVESEAWPVLTRSLERAVEQSEEGTTLRGMSSQTTRERHLLTLLAMPVLSLFKPCALNTYSGTALGLLTGRHRPYSADEMDHFITSCVRVGWTEPLTADAAGWATQLWATNEPQATDALSPAEGDVPAHLYWDWHVKTVYSDYHLPRTEHGTSQRIVGARKQLMLHDEAGHLLFMCTYRGDTHLIDGMVDGTAYYEGLAESQRLTHQIFDREGLSVAHFKELINEGRQFITCLRSNQYDGLDSFDLHGSFQPFRYDKHEKLIQEIADASYAMKDRRTGEDALPLRAILLRKPTDDADDGEDDAAHLHVIITPNREAAAADIANRYRARQTKQENAIRDWWLPLGGDVNVGYDKHQVENSELAKRKVELEARLERLERYIPACELRLQRVQRRHQKHAERYQAELEAAQQELRDAIQQREARGEAALDIYCWAKAEEARIQEHLEPLRARMEAAAEKIEQERDKQQRYRKEQKEKERALARITQEMADRPMYELDNRKDQLMSALRICLVNILQWLRDTVFPKSYAHATYKTLAPFVQMGGFIIEHPERIEILLDGFWQSAKQRDLEEVVARCNARQFTAPGGRPLQFGICPAPGHI
ncbi:MAG: hypothetical protein ACE5I2_14465 [Anaerolineae bacterium]